MDYICVRCGAKLKETDNFCSNCGNKAEKNMAIKQLKPSLYVTFNPNAKPSPDSFYKFVSFHYIISTKQLIAEAGFGDAEGNHYYPSLTCDPHSTDEIFAFTAEMFGRMIPGNYEGTTSEPMNMPKFFGVKTEGGAARKYEYFTLQYDERWNEKKKDYYFCKGERSTTGFLRYEDFVVGDDLSKDAFVKGYNKLLGRIEKRLARKAAKKEAK